jgi:hypothetical protein
MTSNLKEKLAISQWLHERKFEPDMWFTDIDFYPEKKNCEIQLSSRKDFKEDKPFMTLNRVLELLPESLEINGDYCQLEFNKAELYIGYIFVDTLDFWELFEADYELAALKLLVKVIEAGHLEVNKTDQSVDFDKVKSTDAE